MAQLPQFTASPIDLDSIADFDGRVTVFLSETGRLSQLARRVNRLMRGALERFGESDRFAKMSAGDAVEMPFPAGMAAQAVQVIRLERKPSQEQARKAGAAIGKALGGSDTLVLQGNQQLAADIALGCALRAYRCLRLSKPLSDVTRWTGGAIRHRRRQPLQRPVDAGWHVGLELCAGDGRRLDLGRLGDERRGGARQRRRACAPADALALNCRGRRAWLAALAAARVDEARRARRAPRALPLHRSRSLQTLHQ